MTASPAPTQIVRIKTQLAQSSDFAVVWQLFEEYFDAVQVVVRDNPDTVLQHLTNNQSSIWTAYAGSEAAGCIALRPLPALSTTDHLSGEIKRLYVRPKFRRCGVAAALLSALESYALSQGVEALYLDSKDDLKEALAFYQRSGYSACERYNDNPQATVFMRKSFTDALLVRDFCLGDEEAFWLLNEAWISKLFKLEPKDIETLRHPNEYILSKGGRIYMACRGSERVGCCALLNLGNGSYEVAKMGVAEPERGKGVGRALLQHAITDARRQGIPRLYLETNHTLKNAIHLYESVGFQHLNAKDVTPSPYVRADVFMEMILS